jgi:hypothetical protein
MWVLALGGLAILLAWLVRVSSAMQSVPEEVRKLSPRRWTKKDLWDTYGRLKQTPIDFLKLVPPRLDRRYVVVGGSGEIPSPGYSIS